MYCRYCGKELQENSQFCTYCGTNQNNALKASESTPIKMCELHLIPKNIKSVLHLYLDEMTYTWAPFTAKEIVVKLLPGIHLLEATIYQHKSMSAKAKDMVEMMTAGVINYKHQEDVYPLDMASGDVVYLEVSMSVFSKVQIKEMER